jgi:hypothetical protein
MLGELDAYYHRSCVGSGEFGLPHSGQSLHSQTLPELLALFEFLSVGGGIVRLDHDHTQHSSLLREGGARRYTDEQANYNDHSGISFHSMFPLSLSFGVALATPGFGPGTWYVQGVGKSNQ